MKSAFITVITFILTISSNCGQKVDHRRFKRFLIYPQQAPTRYLFITGIGIPADLTYESLVVAYVLKAMYWLPFNETVFRENPFFPEYSADNYLDPNFDESKKISGKSKRSPLRWAIYKFIVDRVESYGYNGHECMLKAICDASALHFDRLSNVFGELMHIFLSPATSKDLSSDLTIDYFEAEKIGRNGTESCEIYNCGLSLLDLVSTTSLEA